MALKPMRRRHLPAVMKIEAKVYAKPWTLGIFLSELALSDTRRYFVATENQQVIGYCGLMVVIDEGHITNIAVDPAFEGRGTASRLMLNAFEVATSMGVKDMTLEVRASNRRAQALYFRFGFQPVGIRKAYYTDNLEDAVIMWNYGIDTEENLKRLAEIEQNLTSEGTWRGGSNDDT